VEFAKMMPPPLAADDVSPLRSEMMFATSCRNDALFALTCPQAHIIAAGNIIRVARIICPPGQTSLKKARFRVLFSGYGVRKKWICVFNRWIRTRGRMLCGAMHPILFSFLSYLFTGKSRGGERKEE
jgi:hypothetical protein